MSLKIPSNLPPSGARNLRAIEERDQHPKGPRRQAPKKAAPAEEPFDPVAAIIIEDAPAVHGPEYYDIDAEIGQALDNLARLAVDNSAANVDTGRWYTSAGPNKTTSSADIHIYHGDQSDADDDIDWSAPRLTALYAEDFSEYRDPLQMGQILAQFELSDLAANPSPLPPAPEPEKEPIIVVLDPYPARPLAPSRYDPYLDRSLYRITAVLDRITIDFSGDTENGETLLAIRDDF